MAVDNLFEIVRSQWQSRTLAITSVSLALERKMVLVRGCTLGTSSMSREFLWDNMLDTHVGVASPRLGEHHGIVEKKG